jgi:hypothetical protein
MTKKQMLAECVRLAPDFRMTFERPGDVDTVVARFTDAVGKSPIALAMTLGPHGRASVETQLLQAALGRLRRKAA